MNDDKGGYHSRLEEMVLRDLRPRFEALGYIFVEHPKPDDLPDFMAGWIPDAVAVRGSQRVAIEVAGSHLLHGERLLDIRSRFDGQKAWRLSIVSDWRTAERDVMVPTPTVEGIRSASAAIEDLVEHGQVPTALVMSFALLETTLRVVASESASVARKPGTVIQALTMEGLIDQTTESELRKLIETRNRIVHGSLDEHVDPASISMMLAAVETALAATFAA